MTALFADTYFFIAYLNPKDEFHSLASEYMLQRSDPIVTSIWILNELGNFLSRYRSRRFFAPLYAEIRADSRFRIVPALDRHFENGLRLYSRHRDKDWSFTDCISFTVMKEHEIIRALTADRHFLQAGFSILFNGASEK